MCGSRFFGLSLGLCLGLTISIPALAQCSDMDNDGFGRPGDTSCRNGGQSDCNDADPRINPAATEVCDGFDNDCDTLLDEGPDCDGVLAGVDKIGNDIQLTSNESSTGSPAIAWSGEHYAIVFNELPPTHDLFIIILDELGNIVVPQRPVFPAAVAVRPAFPDITFSGTEYGIVWEEYRDDVTDPEIYFARLTREGSLVGGALRLSHAPDESTKPKIVWTGDKYAVLWRDKRAADGTDSLYFREVSADGVAGDELRLELGNQAGNSLWTFMDHDLLWNGIEYAIGAAERDVENQPNNFFWFALLDPQTHEIDVETLIEGGVNPEDTDLFLTWNGRDGQFGFWRQSGSNMLNPPDVLLTLLDQNGALVDPVDPHLAVTENEANGGMPVTAIWNGDEYGLLFRPRQMFPSVDYRARFSRVTATGDLLSERVLITSVTNDLQLHNIRMSWSGGVYGIAFAERTDGNDGDLLFNRVGVDMDGDSWGRGRDCDDADLDVWLPPGPVSSVFFQSDKQTLTWLPPEEPGTTLTLDYDTLRSSDPANFSAAVAICLETDDTDTTAVDAEVPPVGGMFSYLPRGVNLCGEGSLGTNGDGLERSGRECP